MIHSLRFIEKEIEAENPHNYAIVPTKKVKILQQLIDKVVWDWTNKVTTVKEWEDVPLIKE